MAKIRIVDSFISNNGQDGIHIGFDGANADISMERSTISGNLGSGISIRPSTRELIEAGINPSVPMESLKKAKEVLGDIDFNDERTINKRLSGIGFTDYLSTSANLTTVAQFIMGLIC
ncbi:hypothetical protein [Atlantibacter hermannii]|uniref:hypothetical protein n=1 Tax=Atlantibacter hermannii TaxID=565 RepID=UPI0028B1822B|nr:hypothetical protein [Atlantibacter hermannii]